MRELHAPSLGVWALVCGILSMISFTPAFVLPTAILAAMAFARLQFKWAALGLVCAAIGTMTSPTMIFIFGSIATFIGLQEAGLI